ncbi:acyl-CoA dehydrogenase family protein [Haloechinothrix sp. LS1_15]|uniref:acyl-CoA dehydrogenase family protein n=1 Tax=Haloechinothrix sp. LS1_15 TaxID=2652248 RepID=UPI00294730E5|nr:acyl-CoA dehydrogenase family protein [Haloechinothrix sp. LS1_15]MDV6014171.1 acyl-CoA dehydrogenase [Haloechinothrix sp. LS1_15]
MPGTTEEQTELGRTVRSVLERESSPERVREAMAGPRGYDEKLWSVLCEQVGVAALAVPERFDGFGAGVRELQVVAEELGRQLAPGPLLGSATLATLALLASGDDEACERLLPPLASGGALATLAWTGEDGRWDPAEPALVAAPDGRHHRVTGTAHYVLDGDTAGTLLAIAICDDGIGLFEVEHPGGLDSGVRREHTPGMDPGRRLATVALDRAAATRLGNGDFGQALRGVRDAACAVLAAEQVGAAARALEATVSYTSERVQFGRPIGSFQALKHRMADMHVLVESARSISAAAGADIDAGVPEAEDTTLAARVYCSDTLSRVAGEMIQMHGGIAITAEHDAHLYFKRAHSSTQLFGQPHTHLDRRLRAWWPPHQR